MAGIQDREALDGNVVQFDFGTPNEVKLTITDGDDAGVAGQVLFSNGPGQRPSWQDIPPPAQTSGDFQRFNSSGTWNKPAGFDANSRVLIRAWGAGGSGAAGTGDEGGGGGGGYSERWVILSELASSVTVTIGSGGSSVNGSNSGNNGGNSTFGSHLTGYGGAGGVNNSSGGGGGGPLSAGSGSTPGQPLINDGTAAQGAGQASAAGRAGIWHGGGGSYGANNGASSYYGGGGGGGHNSSSAGSGGTSVVAGNGGAAGVNGANGTAGSQPGGGGGASENTSGSVFSGVGGAGRIEVFVFPAAA